MKVTVATDIWLKHAMREEHPVAIANVVTFAGCPEAIIQIALDVCRG
jgi:hypothetical protein